MKNKIRLEGKYAILRNDAISPVPFEGIIYKNVEAAYQAQKCPERAHEFENLMPYDAIELGRTVELRPDWDEVKDILLQHIVTTKVLCNEAVRKALLESGDADFDAGRLGILLKLLREDMMSVAAACEDDSDECDEMDCENCPAADECPFAAFDDEEDEYSGEDCENCPVTDKCPLAGSSYNPDERNNDIFRSVGLILEVDADNVEPLAIELDDIQKQIVLNALQISAHVSGLAVRVPSGKLRLDWAMAHDLLDDCADKAKE